MSGLISVSGTISNRAVGNGRCFNLMLGTPIQLHRLQRSLATNTHAKSTQSKEPPTSLAEKQSAGQISQQAILIPTCTFVGRELSRLEEGGGVVQHSLYVAVSGMSGQLLSKKNIQVDRKKINDLAQWPPTAAENIARDGIDRHNLCGSDAFIVCGVGGTQFEKEDSSTDHTVLSSSFYHSVSSGYPGKPSVPVNNTIDNVASTSPGTGTERTNIKPKQESITSKMTDYGKDAFGRQPSAHIHTSTTSDSGKERLSQSSSNPKKSPNQQTQSQASPRKEEKKKLYNEESYKAGSNYPKIQDPSAEAEKVRSNPLGSTNPEHIFHTDDNIGASEVYQVQGGGSRGNPAIKTRGGSSSNSDATDFKAAPKLTNDASVTKGTSSSNTVSGRTNQEFTVKSPIPSVADYLQSGGAVGEGSKPSPIDKSKLKSPSSNESTPRTSFTTWTVLPTRRFTNSVGPLKESDVAQEVATEATKTESSSPLVAHNDFCVLGVASGQDSTGTYNHQLMELIQKEVTQADVDQLRSQYDRAFDQTQQQWEKNVQKHTARTSTPDQNNNSLNKERRSSVSLQDQAMNQIPEDLAFEFIRKAVNKLNKQERHSNQSIRQSSKMTMQLPTNACVGVVDLSKAKPSIHTCNNGSSSFVIIRQNRIHYQMGNSASFSTGEGYFRSIDKDSQSTAPSLNNMNKSNTSFPESSAASTSSTSSPSLSHSSSKSFGTVAGEAGSLYSSEILENGDVLVFGSGGFFKYVGNKLQHIVSQSQQHPHHHNLGIVPLQNISSIAINLMEAAQQAASSNSDASDVTVVVAQVRSAFASEKGRNLG